MNLAPEDVLQVMSFMMIVHYTSCLVGNVLVPSLTKKNWSRSQSSQTFFFVKQRFFFPFLQLSLAILMYRQYFPMLQTLKLKDKNLKKRRNQSLVGLTPGPFFTHRLLWILWMRVLRREDFHTKLFRSRRRARDRLSQCWRHLQIKIGRFFNIFGFETKMVRFSVDFCSLDSCASVFKPFVYPICF